MKDICEKCNGSGEGKFEGLHCEACNGSGVTITPAEIEERELMIAMQEDFNEMFGVENETVQ